MSFSSKKQRPQNRSQRKTETRRQQRQLHGDWVADVAGDVPARVLAGVWEKRARARDIFFGTQRVDLVFHFVAVMGNGQNADAVYRGGGRAEFRNSRAKMEPSEVGGIGDEEKGDKTSEKTGEKTNGGREWIGIRHGESVLCPGRGSPAR